MKKNTNHFNFKEDSDLATGCIAVVIALAILIFAIFLGPAIELWIWNDLFVEIFNAPILTYWQMFGINLFMHMIIPTSTYTSKRD